MIDWLNNSSARLRNAWEALTPSGRVAGAGLLVVIAASLWFLAQTDRNGGAVHLMGAATFSASDLPGMEAAFAKAKLSEYELDGNRVRVPRGQHALYMAALADAGALPRGFGSYLEQALAGDTLLESKRAREERMKVALQNELALIIRSMQGIESASVLYDIRTVQGTGLRRSELITATVSVKPVGNEPLDPQRVPMIRNLVVGAIAGLTPADVTVADLNGRTFAGHDAHGLGDPLQDPYLARKLLYEQHLAEKIRAVLSLVSGATVQVTAELDPEIRHVEKSVRHEGRPVASSAGGPAADGASRDAAAGGIAPGVSSTEIERELKGLTPKSVQVSISVPSDYYRQVWRERNGGSAPSADALTDVTDEVNAQIERAIAALLPAAGSDAPGRVTVTSFQSFTLPSPVAVAPPAFGDSLWLREHRHQLGVAALALVGLLILRSLLRSAVRAGAALPAAPMEAIERAAGHEATTRVDEPHAMPAARPEPAGSPTGGLADDLSAQVREDPTAAATVVRNWLGKAG